MSDKITKKKYYMITFDLASPLALGSGENDTTDKDLMRDATGKPFIPASSIAGVVRDYLEEKNPDLAKKYLGFIVKATKENKKTEQVESSVIFYDAVISAGYPIVSVRDSVALDEYKTAKDGAKIDMEVLEPGVTFTTYIEQDYSEGKDDDYGKEIVRALLGGSPVFGGKGMRGYGRIANIKAKKKEFVFPDDVEKWLEFDMFSSSDWKDCNIAADGENAKEIRLSLAQRGGISIRKYTTRVSTDEKTEPDMEQLTLRNGTPVIPGTSWAGAIAHRMREFGINTDEEGTIFGYVKGEGQNAKARSKITFSESELSGAKEKTLSRNSIDRFTGGAVDKALFTERTYYGGKTDLVIGWRSKDAMPEKERKALAAALTDLHYGILAVGGETSIGRGTFSIVSVNDKGIDKETKGEDVYKLILSEIEGAFK